MSGASKNDDSQAGHLTVPCPRCGSPLGPFVTVCPECGASIGTTRNDLPKSKHRYSITLGDVMFIIGSVAIVLGVARVWLEAAAVLSVVILIALVRTLWARHRARVRKIAMSFGDVITLVTASLAIAVLIAISAGIAFCVTCFPIGIVGFAFNSSNGAIIGIITGIVTAAFVAWGVGKLVWNSGKPPKLGGTQYLDEPTFGSPPNSTELPQ